MNSEGMHRRAIALEADLKAEGRNAEEISGILGAAFMASLVELPRSQRELILTAHLCAIRESIEAVMNVRQ